MPELNQSGIQERAAWEDAHILLPQYDREAMTAYTHKNPTWLHFGAGNIFRGFIARLQQCLLNEGKSQSGIVAAETFDYGIIDRIYKPYDNLALLVGLKADGTTVGEVIGSIAEGLCAGKDYPTHIERLQEIAANPSLQMISFTITEKGYALTDMKGSLLPVAEMDIQNGPENAVHAMGIVAGLLHRRYLAGGLPVAMVSMDNCSHNGDKLKDGVLQMARGWKTKGFVEEGFITYLEDEQKVSFPWSMIDKITPRPSDTVFRGLREKNISGMDPLVTDRGTFIAPFVNAEIPEYLVIEDKFPNGRPALEKAGVYFTDRDTVNATERMKVTTCLNPLHTALAVFGCLLGYDSIAAEMRDAQLKALVEKIGYEEGMPVVVNPGIIDPKAFIGEVIDQRLPNPFIPDTPQRIATDTSQKVPIRFGETIKAYKSRPELDSGKLTYIPLTLAGWLRYLMGVDDSLQPMEVSADPLREELQKALSIVKIGDTQCGDTLKPILSNPVLFGTDLYEAGLGEKVEGMFLEMIVGKDAVRRTLERYLG